ncbi:MAG: hypothetical protein AB7N99_07945 [Simkaniaceae bacterium]|jgi:hypothetical protein
MKHKSLFLLLSFCTIFLTTASADIRDGDGLASADSFGEAWAAAKKQKEQEEKEKKEREEREKKEREEKN